MSQIEMPPEFALSKQRLELFQREQYKTLKAVSKLCEDNGLRYYIAYGTALGAARHLGFIPWDDDVDVVMPRSDYERLSELIKKGKEGSLVSLEWKHDIDFRFSFMKVGRSADGSIDHSATAIDVFPLDVVPRTKILRKCLWVITNALLAVLNARAGVYHGYRQELYKLLFFWFPRDQRKIHRFVDWINSSCGNWRDGCLVGHPYSVYGEKDFKPVEYYGVGGGKKVEFMGEMFFAPVMLDEYLKSFFGDWHQLPPVANRLPHHESDGPWFYFQFSDVT